MESPSQSRRACTSSERRFLQITPIFLLMFLAILYFGFWRFAYWITTHVGAYNEHSEALISEGRIILCTILAGATGAYLRIGLNPEEMRKRDSSESTFLSIVQVICGGIVGFFVYVIVKSKIILKVLYVGDVSTVTLDWDGSIALSLLAGLLATEIVRGVVRSA
jgi:hypothetical protein